MFYRYFKFVHKSFLHSVFRKAFLPLLFFSFQKLQSTLSNSDIEVGFNQVDLVLIDPNYRDYDVEQNCVKGNFGIGTCLDETE